MLSPMVIIWNNEIAKIRDQQPSNSPSSPSSSSAQLSPARIESGHPVWARVLHHVKMSASLYSDSSLSMLMDCVSA
ncbi:hypothetical protein BVRB_9g218280 [Beta vulgaris subsp. vulgaris]|nr:hypothetical protein BVRB_9g218280 [Beta vulgaris subsp. vulgaris]